MQVMNNSAHFAMGPSDGKPSPLWMADGPPVHTEIDGQQFPFVTPARDGWDHLLLPVRREYRAQLEIEQAHVVLSHLLPDSDVVGLGFWPELCGQRGSAFTLDKRNSDGIIDASRTGLVSVRDDSYFVDTFTGSGADLLLSLDDAAGGFEWPGLIWHHQQEWVVDSGPGRAFCLLSAPPDICAEIAADPRTGGVAFIDR